MNPLTRLVNRSHLLPRDFIPDDLMEPDIPFDAPAGDEKRLLAAPAALAAAQLFAAAKEQKLFLCGISGYRSYSRQEEIYQQRKKEMPESYVNLYVAPPGASEHQTGLALDVSCPAAEMELKEDFALTPEGRWLKLNAPLYGFILRYPRGKETITGYAWEPWHIRYVTRSLAHCLSLTGMTLEEYRQMYPEQ